MQSEENKAESLNNLLLSLNNNKHNLNDILKENVYDQDTVNAVKNLKVDFVNKNYSPNGLERYLRSVIDYWEDNPILDKDVKTHENKRRLLYNILLSPAKLLAKTYDYILDKTNSHFLSTIGMSMVAGELVAATSFTAETAYFSYAFNDPFPSLFASEAVLNSSYFIQIPLLAAIVSSLFMGLVIGGTSLVFNYKKIDKQEIIEDIKKYSREFKKVFEKYNKAFFTSKIAPSFSNLNALYMLSCSNAYNSVSQSASSLREYETLMLPYISETLHKEISPRSIIHKSPKNIGGFTLVYNSVSGKFIKNKSYSPVFLNTDRLSAVPEYLFALFHELAHGAGASTEQMASYYAEKAIEKVQDDFPLEGYDLFLSVNKLESAIATLYSKVESKDEFFGVIKKLHLPKFVEESFNYSFNPSFSITFPLNEAFYSGKIESKFFGLYSSGPYLAEKMVEKGFVKTF